MGSRDEHGTSASYQAGCRCDDCRAAETLRRKRRQRTVARGVPELTSAARSRRHLEYLSAHRMGTRSVAAASGLHRQTLRAILEGRTTRVRLRTEERILAVHLGQGPEQTLVDAGATQRRVEDLVGIGWTRAEVSRALGHTTPQLRLGPSGRVRRSTADAVRRLHASNVVRKDA